MIRVPYWWDRKQSSLAATIYNARPDLFKVKPEGKAIPESDSASEDVTLGIIKKCEYVC